MYVVDYALTPGQSINLADKDYGSGTITFEANGTDITFTNVNMNVPESAKYMDRDIAMATHTLLYYPVYTPQDYRDEWPSNFNFTFIGDNQIINNLYQNRDAIGVELNTYFHTVDNLAHRPTVTLRGDKPLTLHGGARSINTDGNLVLDLDLNITQVHQEAYTTAVYSAGLVVEKNHALDIASNHGVIESDGDVIIKDGVTIKAKSTPTHGRNFNFGFTAIAAAGDLKMSHAKLDFTGEVKAEGYPTDYYLSRLPALAASGDVEIKDSDVSIEVGVTGEQSRTFAYSFAGILVNNEAHAINIDNSKVRIAIDTPEVENVAGISSLGAATIANSDIEVNVAGRGQVLGISAQDLLTMKNSSVSTDVTAEDGDYGKEFAAIVGRPILVDQADSSYRINAKINQGAAFVSVNKYALPAAAERPTYDASYVPTLTKLNGAKILSPADGVLSSHTYVGYYSSEYLAETPYSLSNTATPALNVTIAVPAVSPSDSSAPAPTSDPNDRHASGDNVPNEAKPQGCSDTAPAGTPDLFQINRVGTDATLYFTPVPGVTSYHVVFGHTVGDERYGGVALQATDTSGVLAINVHNLAPAQTYSFKIAPVNGCATGTWSNWLTASRAFAGRTISTYRY